MPVQPLTRRNREGVVYRRDPAVELQIERALVLDTVRLIEHARLLERDCPEYLQEEALVYLLREYHRRGDPPTVNALTAALLRRCAKFINRKLQALEKREQDDAFCDAIAAVFDPIFDLNSDRGDFRQVRFWVVAGGRTTTVFNRYVRRHEEEQQTVPLSSLAGYDPDPEEDAVRRNVPQRAREEPSITTERLALYRDGLSVMKEPHRTAFILRYYEEWPIEGSDPAVPTISRHFGKDPRTISNWLNKAEKELERWRGE